MNYTKDNVHRDTASRNITSRNFIIASLSGDGRMSISENPRWHASRVDAERERDRLANTNPGWTYVVLQACSAARSGTLTYF